MATAVAIRDEQLNIRLNPQEMRLARALADHYGLTPAFMVRMLIREKGRELGITGEEPATLAAEVPPPPPSRPRSKTTKKR